MSDQWIVAPHDYVSLEKWFPVIRHLMSITEPGRNQFVTTTIFIDKDRNPVLWGGFEKSNLYPATREIEIKETP